MLSDNGFYYAACPVRFTIVSAGCKFRPVLNFAELHTLTQATCSYVLLLSAVIELNVTTQPDWYGTNQIFSAASESQTGASRGERGDPEKVRFHPQPVLI